MLYISRFLSGLIRCDNRRIHPLDSRHFYLIGRSLHSDTRLGDFLITFFVFEIFTCFFHFMRLFWYHVLTCICDNPSVSARSMRSGVDRYFWLQNLFSRPSSWWIEHTAIWERERERAIILVTKSICGADCWTDHKLIMTKLSLQIQQNGDLRDRKRLRR